MSQESASRRLGVLAAQLGAGPSDTIQLAVQPTAASAFCRCSGPVTQSSAYSAYASIDGQPSSYARVHGDVSRAPAAWMAVPVVAKEQLQEVLYHKAEGEGIAKVCTHIGALQLAWVV
jgi:hypothetical protein